MKIFYLFTFLIPVFLPSCITGGQGQQKGGAGISIPVNVYKQEMGANYYPQTQLRQFTITNPHPFPIHAYYGGRQVGWVNGRSYIVAPMMPGTTLVFRDPYGRYIGQNTYY